MSIARRDNDPDIPPWELRHRLARSLEHADVAAAEMATYLGVSETTMRNYLAGRTAPRPGSVRAWALRCGVPYEWLVEDPEGGCDVPVGGFGYNDSASTPPRVLRAA